MLQVLQVKFSKRLKYDMFHILLFYHSEILVILRGKKKLIPTKVANLCCIYFYKFTL